MTPPIQQHPRTPPALSTKAAVDSPTPQNDGCAHSTALCPPSEDMRAPVCLFVSLYNLMPKI